MAKRGPSRSLSQPIKIVAKMQASAGQHVVTCGRQYDTFYVTYRLTSRKLVPQDMLITSTWKV